MGIGEDCKMISVDSLNGGFSFIKADVEGSETAMLKGAESTILRCRTKMQIACYHRTGDLTDIPRAVCKIRNDYRIYMRHFPGLPAWDINYSFSDAVILTGRIFPPRLSSLLTRTLE